MPAFLLPDLGEGLTEAEIVTWRVQAGDVVAVNQTVVEVETAKAMVEVPVPFAGRVTALHGEPGDVLAVGAPLITVAGAGGERDPSPDQDLGTGRLATPFAEPGVATPDPAVNGDAVNHDDGTRRWPPSTRWPPRRWPPRRRERERPHRLRHFC